MHQCSHKSAAPPVGISSGGQPPTRKFWILDSLELDLRLMRDAPKLIKKYALLLELPRKAFGTRCLLLGSLALDFAVALLALANPLSLFTTRV